MSAADFFAGLVTLAGGEFCFDFFLAGLTDLETDFRAALLAGSLIDTLFDLRPSQRRIPC